ncbi:hypothetical protein EV401DRAFT_1929090 [Pisolithus croceorrhizus]|nr:hypothetical protein EV401DRAFT_1929090 [Pisolithus croceorrhizus]
MPRLFYGVLEKRTDVCLSFGGSHKKNTSQPRRHTELYDNTHRCSPIDDITSSIIGDVPRCVRKPVRRAQLALLGSFQALDSFTETNNLPSTTISGRRGGYHHVRHWHFTAAIPRIGLDWRRIIGTVHTCCKSSSHGEPSFAVACKALTIIITEISGVYRAICTKTQYIAAV